MIKRVFATLVASLAALYAAPSHASGGFSGYYLASFTYPGGTFKQCVKLTPENHSTPGYKFSGFWTGVSYPLSGRYVVFKNTIHLAATVNDESGLDYLTVDGKLSGGQTVGATFDYFNQGAYYFAAGSMTEMKDASCASSK